jgi:hypothetical protein
MSDNANTGTFTEYQALVEKLPELVKKAQRLTAGQLRITRENNEVRDEIRKLLDASGVGVVTCDGHEVRACPGRDGRDTVRVSKIRE